MSNHAAPCRAAQVVAAWKEPMNVPRSIVPYCARSTQWAKAPASRKPIAAISPPTASARVGFQPNAPRLPRRGAFSLVAFRGRAGPPGRHVGQTSPSRVYLTEPLGLCAASFPGALTNSTALVRPGGASFAATGRISHGLFAADGRTVSWAAAVGVGNQVQWADKVPKRPPRAIHPPVGGMTNV